MNTADSRLHIREGGTGSGRPILFLHGWSCHGGFFQRSMADLAGRHHCIAPDLPGHGRTGCDGPALSIQAAADACAELLRSRDLSDTVVVGWSMGAHVAFSMIERHGCERIGGLVVVDMTAKILNDATWDYGIAGGFDADRNALALRLMKMDWPTYAAALTRNMFADGIVPKDGQIAALLADIRANDPAMMAAMWASLSEQDFRPLLPRIAVPTILAHGAKSRIYAPEVAHRLAGMMPDARIETFAGAGHSPHLEEPERFSVVLRAFAGAD